MSYTSPSSPMDYTNNDFRAIFPELLDVVKQLTSKWDPSISNESDPGVILLKLNAIIADKNNYNIDKNILEAFPETLTQEVSARRLYRQLGYNMKWYMSSETAVTLKYIGDVNELPTLGWSMRIPAFTTMVTNESSKVVYTLIEDVLLTREKLMGSAKALEGVYATIKVGGTDRLTYSNLDETNRVYFDDYNVPQNGIFITSELNGVSHTWERVDNIASVAAFDSQYYYEFGVDAQTNTCYIEFPQNAADLIGEYFTVGYVLSSGAAGRITANSLTEFYSDTTVYTRSNELLEEEETVLDSSVLIVTNASASSAGTDPETIEQAAKNYRKVVGTFDTLVTVRDYMNAVFNSGIVSNAQVSDRYSDLQSSYSVVVPADEGYNIKKCVHETAGEADMNAYELKLYLLGNNGQVYSVDTFNSTFDLLKGNQKHPQIVTYLDDSKSISHDYASFLPNTPVLFRNMYSLRIRYIAKSRLDASKVSNVKENIITALLQALNAREVDFGVALNYDELASIVKNSDARIQTVILEDPSYTTYASYFDVDPTNGQWNLKSVPISDLGGDPYVIEFEAQGPQESTFPDATVYKNISDKSKYLFVNTYNNAIYSYVNKQFVLYATSEQVDALKQFVVSRNIFAGVTPAFIEDPNFVYQLNRKIKAEYPEVDRISTNLDIQLDPENTGTNSCEYVLRANETVRVLGPEIVENTNYSTSTKFAVKLNPGRFSGAVSRDTDWSLFEGGMRYGIYTGADVYTDVTSFEYDGVSYNVPHSSGENKIADGITFYNITAYLENKYNDRESDSLYSALLSAWSRGIIRVVTIEDVISIPANTVYQLKAGEYIVFFTQLEDGDFAPYTYFKYTGTNDSTSPILKASFNISIPKEPPSLISDTNLAGTKGEIPYGSSLYKYIDESMFDKYDLSGTKNISMCSVAQATYTDGYFYFMTNNVDKNANGIDIYKLYLEEVGDVKRYILESEEYFIHVSADNSAYEVLGPGTMIEFKSDVPSDIAVQKVAYSLVLNNGLSAFLDYVIPVVDFGSIYVRQQQINNFAEGDELSWRGLSPLNLTTENYVTIDADKLRYTTTSGESKSFGTLNLNDDTLTWMAKSVLNISVSKYIPQTLQNYSEAGATSNQSLTLYSGEDELTTIEPVGLESLLSFVTSYPVEKVGGSKIEVAYTSLVDGTAIPISIQTYSQVQDSPLVWDLGIDPGIVSYPGEWSVPDKEDRLAGAYILEFTADVAYPEGVEYRISGSTNNDGTLFSMPIQGELTQDNSEDAEYSYKLPRGQSTLYLLYAPTGQTYPTDEDGNAVLELQVSIDNPRAVEINSQNCFVKLTPKKFKYFELNTDLSKKGRLVAINSVTSIIQLMHEELPEAASLYKWTYQPTDGYILDPLAAASFFDTLHVYNRYCIPQLRAGFNAVNVNDSLIQIVNNK